MPHILYHSIGEKAIIINRESGSESILAGRFPWKIYKPGNYALWEWHGSPDNLQMGIVHRRIIKRFNNAVIAEEPVNFFYIDMFRKLF